MIVDFAKELHKDSLQRRHWVQFFTLIKAQHLKNSTTFTIIDLSEPGVYRIVRKGCSEEEAHAILKEHGLREKETPPQ